MRKAEWYVSDDDDAAGGTFKVLGGERTYVEDRDCYDATYTTVYRCVAPRHLTRRQITVAIYEAHRSGWCGHEHDCCGCWFYSAYDVKPAGKRNEYVFSVRAARNY